jgi:type II secretory pathway component PulM
MRRFNILAPLWHKSKPLVNSFWQQRQKREKLILLVGLCFVIVVGLYAGLWAPFASYQSRVIQQYSDFQGHIPYIARTLMTYERLQRSNQLPHTQNRLPLKSQLSQMLVNQQLVPFGIQIKMLNTKVAELTFKQAPFDALMTGVESLNKQGIFVIKAQIQPVNNKGIVQGVLTLAMSSKE